MDAFEEQAAFIKANPHMFRVVGTVKCDCSQPHKTMAVVYAGKDGQVWVWTAGGRGPMNRPDRSTAEPITPDRIPPRAVPVPRRSTDIAYPAIALCPKCRRGRLLLCSVGAVIDAARLEAPTWARVRE